MALDFLIVQKESEVCPPRHCLLPWGQAHLEMGTAPPQTEGAQEGSSLRRLRWRRVQPLCRGWGGEMIRAQRGRALGTRQGGDPAWLPALGSWLQVRGSSPALGRREPSPVAGGSTDTQEDGGWPAKGSRDRSPQRRTR